MHEMLEELSIYSTESSYTTVIATKQIKGEPPIHFKCNVVCG